MKRLFKYIFIGTIALAFLLILTIFACNFWINNQSNPYISTSLDQVPNKDFALVLGTAKFSKQGGINKFFKHRMEAAAQLYYSDKIKYILVSGDNRRTSYNETRDMRKYLHEVLNIPSNVIIDDYAGFRTLDSVLRAKLVFGLDSFIIVSQKFQNQRAIFIARHHGIDAFGFNADNPNYKSMFKVRIREYLARVKSVMDVYLLQLKPKYYQQTENLLENLSPEQPVPEPPVDSL